jgi:hypothetical protein
MPHFFFYKFLKYLFVAIWRYEKERKKTWISSIFLKVVYFRIMNSFKDHETYRNNFKPMCIIINNFSVLSVKLQKAIIKLIIIRRSVPNEQKICIVDAKIIHFCIIHSVCFCFVCNKFVHEFLNMNIS